MLTDEVILQSARQPQNSTVLVTPTSNNPTNHTQPSPDNQPNGPPPPYPSHIRGRGRGRSQSFRGRGYRGRHFHGQYPNPPWSPPQYPHWAWWNTPPCPYPSQPTGRPSQPHPPPAAHYAGFSAPSPLSPLPANAAPQVTNFDPLNPSDLSQAFTTMQLNYTDPNLIMDTRAERHVTENKGMIH
ncbi:hypothetical protein E3N88_38861 [Mikania micrantha]|uniref:Uncharacterized protein n=1 Tax=Mikania micrantha TaxID=192012 RepID=A0A5N6LV57_9ASTR|nr:hypothetical protein E3N88_38861 [Mikania micrantha]